MKWCNKVSHFGITWNFIDLIYHIKTFNLIIGSIKFLFYIKLLINVNIRVRRLESFDHVLIIKLKQLGKWASNNGSVYKNIIRVSESNQTQLEGGPLDARVAQRVGSSRLKTRSRWQLALTFSNPLPCGHFLERWSWGCRGRSRSTIPELSPPKTTTFRTMIPLRFNLTNRTIKLWSVRGTTSTSLLTPIWRRFCTNKVLNN